MSKTCKKYFFDGAISGKISAVLGEKMQRLDYLCYVSKLLQALGMSVSAHECQCVNTAVNKMTFYTPACWSWGKIQWATQHLICNCVAWPACLLATSRLLPWLLPGAAASRGCGHAVVCLGRAL